MRKEERGRVFSSPPRTSPRSLSRLDVIKTKPRAGPPSRRLINCFVRDTSLFKRNWALPSSLSSSLAISTTLRTLRIRATRTCLYSVLEPAFFSWRQQQRHRGYRNLRRGFDSACLVRRIEDLDEKRDPTVAGVNEKVDQPFYIKSTDAETTS